MTSPAGSSPPSRFVLDEAEFMAAITGPAPRERLNDTHRATLLSIALSTIASKFCSSSIQTTNNNQ